MQLGRFESNNLYLLVLPDENDLTEKLIRFESFECGNYSFWKLDKTDSRILLFPISDLHHPMIV